MAHIGGDQIGEKKYVQTEEGIAQLYRLRFVIQRCHSRLQYNYAFANMSLIASLPHTTSPLMPMTIMLRSNLLPLLSVVVPKDAVPRRSTTIFRTSCLHTMRPRTLSHIVDYIANLLLLVSLTKILGCNKCSLLAKQTAFFLQRLPIMQVWLLSVHGQYSL